MKLFLDTAEVDQIRRYVPWGVVDGVTTNPSLVAKSGRVFEEVIREICGIVDGPVSAEAYGWLWFLLKSYLMVFVMIWLRGTLPRLRVDQLMNFAWKVLVPLALVNLTLTGIGVTIMNYYGWQLNSLVGALFAFITFALFNLLMVLLFRIFYRPPKVEPRSVVLVAQPRKRSGQPAA